MIFASVLVVYLKKEVLMKKLASPQIHTLLLLISITTFAQAQTSLHLSIDAMSWNELSKIEQGDLRYFKTSKDANHIGFALQPFSSANTGPAHASMYTGKSPQEGGWVSNRFLTPQAAIDKPSNAFIHPQKLKLSSLPHELTRQGQKTACLNVPSIQADKKIGECTLHLSFSSPVDNACHISLLSDSRIIDFSDKGPLNDVSQCFLGKMSGLSLKDGTAELVLNSRKLSLATGQVNQITFNVKGEKISKLIWINKISDDTASLYIGPGFVTRANDAFSQLPSRFSTWPGTQDSKSYHLGKISEDGFIATLYFQSNYVFDLTEYLIEEQKLDAIFSYTSLLDTIGHNFLVQSTLQPDYAHHGKRYQQHVEDAYKFIDTKAANLEGKLKKGLSSLHITSDHGMMPIHTNIGINSLVESLGYSVFSTEPDARAYTSGANAHIYLNSVNRKNGKRIDKKETINRLASALRAYELKGVPIFSHVDTNDSLTTVNNISENTGDIVLFATLGYGLDPRKRPSKRLHYASTFDKKILSSMGYSDIEIKHAVDGFLNRSSPGIHGYPYTHNLMNGVFFSSAVDLKKSDENSRLITSMSVANFLSCTFKGENECSDFILASKR
jgi:predicted AlkP superfamily pyrophosphatase or phosphodiesterase